MEVWCTQQNIISMADLIGCSKSIMFQLTLPQHLTVKWEVSSLVFGVISKTFEAKTNLIGFDKQ